MLGKTRGTLLSAAAALMVVLVPSLTNAAVITIDDLTDVIATSFSGFNTGAAFTGGTSETQIFRGTYTGAGPVVGVTSLYSVELVGDGFFLPVPLCPAELGGVGAGGCVSDTLVVSLTGLAGGLVDVTATFVSGAITALTNPNVIAIEDGSFQTFTPPGSGLTVSLRSDCRENINPNSCVQTRVPEPASLAIFGTALAALGIIRRRRRKSI